MKRLTVHVQIFEPHHLGGKNTFSYIVKNEKEIEEKLSLHSKNVKKHYLSNC